MDAQKQGGAVSTQKKKRKKRRRRRRRREKEEEEGDHYSSGPNGILLGKFLKDYNNNFKKEKQKKIRIINKKSI